MKTVKVTIELLVQTHEVDDEEQLMSDILETVIDQIEDGTLDFTAQVEEDEEEEI